MKHCNTCSTDKSLDQFSKSSRNKDGRQSKCKSCVAGYYGETAEHQKQKFSDWIANPENRARAKETRRAYLQAEFAKDAKRSAKMRRRSFMRSGENVAMSDLTDLHGITCLYPGCVRTDIEMDHVIPLSLGGTHTLENLQPLCVTHNRSKGNRNSADYRLVNV